MKQYGSIRPGHNSRSNEALIRRRIAMISTLLICIGVVPQAEANVRLWGEIGYNFRSEINEGSTDLYEHSPVLRLNASSYIYRPWLATIEGGLQLQANRTDLDDGDSSSDSVSGDVLLRLFPQSHFPLEMFAERTTTDNDTDLTGLNLDRTRYGFLQRYVTPGGASFRAGYEHTDLTNRNQSLTRGKEKIRDVGDFFHGSAQKSLQHHNISFDTNFNRIDTLDSPRRTKTSFSSLRHTYRPGARLFAEDLLTYNTSDREEEFTAFSTNILQLTSYAFWRPQVDSRLRLNANLRALTRDSDSRFGPTVQSHGGTGSLFANYDLNSNWLLTSGIGMTGTDLEGDRSTTSFQTVRATFNSDPVFYRDIEASWFGRMEMGNDVDDSDTVQNGGVQIGYNLNRSWTPGNSSTRAELSQSISQNADTDGFSATRLLTDASLMWNLNQTNRSTIARISISDSRVNAHGEDIRGVEGDFQIVNAQLSLNHRFSSSASLSGNATLQTIREYRPELKDVDDTENGKWRPTATIDLTFYKRSVFGISRLSYRSTLRFISDAFVPVLLEPNSINGRENSFWENRFDYMVGRMQVRLVGRLNDVGGKQRILTLFQIRRMIGDV